MPFSPFLKIKSKGFGLESTVQKHADGEGDAIQQLVLMVVNPSVQL